MRLLTCLLLSLLGAQIVFISAQTGSCRSKRHQNCPKCSAGQYQMNCECETCPPRTFTSDSNCETSCHRCFSDCTPDLHLKMVKNCSSTSDVVCECEEGFDCVDFATESICKRCRKRQQPPATTEPCTFPKCNPVSGNTTGHSTDKTQNLLIAVLCPVFLICIFVLLVCLRYRTRIKQTVKKLCSVEAKEAAHMTRETSSEKQQTVPIATANMGSVHVHNPGTVIFSLLGEVTGQIGETKEEKTVVRQPSGGEEYSSVSQPTQSPCVPLSKEEHLNSAFFPSQEQGKDSRVSIQVEEV